jgi:hypothetical protein
MVLPERIVRRFLATQHPYVCWYRASLSEKRGHPSHILVTAALKFTADSPTEKQTMEGSRSAWDYYVFPDGFFEHVKAACSGAYQKAKTLVGDGSKVTARTDPGFEKEARKSVAANRAGYVNFFWINAEIPFAKGQKKQVEDTIAKLLALSTEFSHLMALEVEKL